MPRLELERCWLCCYSFLVSIRNFVHNTRWARKYGENLLIVCNRRNQEHSMSACACACCTWLCVCVCALSVIFRCNPLPITMNFNLWCRNKCPHPRVVVGTTEICPSWPGMCILHHVHYVERSLAATLIHTNGGQKSAAKAWISRWLDKYVQWLGTQCARSMLYCSSTITKPMIADLFPWMHFFLRSSINHVECTWIAICMRLVRSTQHCANFPFFLYYGSYIARIAFILHFNSKFRACHIIKKHELLYYSAVLCDWYAWFIRLNVI